MFTSWDLLNEKIINFIYFKKIKIFFNLNIKNKNSEESIPFQVFFLLFYNDFSSMRNNNFTIALLYELV